MNRWIIIGMTLGIAASIAFWMVIEGRLELDLPIIWIVFLVVGGMILQSFAYISLFVKFYGFPRMRKILGIFTPVGRMALTNYVMQSVFYTVFFFHWFPGFKLHGKTTITEAYILAIIFFAFQIVFSHYWLQKNGQGPLEHVWRRLSYKGIHTNRDKKDQIAPQKESGPVINYEKLEV